MSVGLTASQAFVTVAADRAAASGGTGAAAGPYAQGPGVDPPEGFTQFRENSCLAFWMDEPAGPLARFMSGLRLPIQLPAEELMAALTILSPAADASAQDAAQSPTGAGAAQNTMGAGTAQSPTSAGTAQNPTGQTNGAEPGGTGALYEIKLRIKTPSEVNARSLVTLFSTARLFIPRPGSAQGSADAEIFELLSLLFARPPVQEGVYLNLRTAPINESGVALLFRLFSLYSMQN
jgi:hypothetical protein